MIQRVRLRWGTSGRGALAANRRRQVPTALALPPLPDAAVVAHDVLAADANDYQPQASLATGDAARGVGVWFITGLDTLEVDRMPHRSARFPVRRGPDRLFALRPGQVGRYRTNYRLAAWHGWQYEQWTIHIVWSPHPDPSIFLTDRPVSEIDQRVSLYGGERYERMVFRH